MAELETLPLLPVKALRNSWQTGYKKRRGCMIFPPFPLSPSLSLSPFPPFLDPPLEGAAVLDTISFDKETTR